VSSREVVEANRITREEFIARVAPYAVQIAHENNLWASVMLAQAICESDGGNSELAKNANAYFGIRATSDWLGEIYKKQTKEYVDGRCRTITASFRKYPDLLGSFEDYAAEIRGTRLSASEYRYKKCMERECSNS
jgi:flagellum-specific peptidoglycan hydrolase FlgJ